MKHTSNISLLCIYVNAAGGSRIATEYICSEMMKNTRLSVHTLKLPPSYETTSGSLMLLRTVLLPVRFFVKIFIFSLKQNQAPNYIYTPSMFVSFVAPLVPAYRHSKVIRHFHGFDFGRNNNSLQSYPAELVHETPIRLFYLSVLLRLYSFIEHTSLQLSSLIIVPSAYSRRTLLKRYRDTHTKIKIVPYGISRVFFPRKNIKKKHKNILYVGRFVKEKGISELLKAFSLLDATKFSLTLICPDFTNIDLLKEIKTISSDRTNVTMIQNPNPQMLSKIYCMSDLCVLPSTSFFEQSPLVYFESLACGTPMLTSNKVGGALVYQKKISRGLILKDTGPEAVASGIMWYCSLPDKQKKSIQAACLSVARRFSWRKTTFRIINFLGIIKKNPTYKK